MKGGVIAAYHKVRLIPQNVAALHLDVFDQPGGNHFCIRALKKFRKSLQISKTFVAFERPGQQKKMRLQLDWQN